MKLEILPDADWARRVADRWSERLSTNPMLTMCLPSGNTPKPVYSEMASRVSAGEVSFRDASVFLLDEFGGLPPRDPARCETMIRRDLVDLVDLPAPEFRLPDVDGPDPAAVVARYGAAVLAAGLDLTIVGLGANGHIGLNEPGSALDAVARVVRLHDSTRSSADGYGAGETPRWGVTLGFAEVLTSKEIWVLVSGAHKAAILAAALDDPTSPDIPATALRGHPDVTILADEGAAPG